MMNEVAFRDRWHRYMAGYWPRTNPVDWVMSQTGLATPPDALPGILASLNCPGIPKLAPIPIIELRAPVTDAHVNDALHKILLQDGVFVPRPSGGAADRDRLTVDLLRATVGGEPMQGVIEDGRVVIGAGAWPALEDAMAGAQTGETRVARLEHEGKPVSMTLAVRSIDMMQLPDVVAFARALGLPNRGAVRRAIRAAFETEYGRARSRQRRRAVLDVLDRRYQYIPVPPEMVQDEVRHVRLYVHHDIPDDAITIIAERRARLALVMEAIRASSKVRVTEAEIIESALQVMAEDPQKRPLAHHLDNPENRNRLRGMILERKTHDLIARNVVATSSYVSRETLCGGTWR